MPYASRTDLTAYGIPANALGGLTTAQQDAALDAASKRVDSYLRGRYGLPLIAWGVEITQATCVIAAYQLMHTRGYNPASGADVNIENRYHETIAWLEQVQRQAAHPDVTPQPAAPTYNRPTVISSSAIATGSSRTGKNRGW